MFEAEGLERAAEKVQEKVQRRYHCYLRINYCPVSVVANAKIEVAV